MKNILNKKHLNEVITRINHVTQDDKSEWGKMNVSEMICHCADQIRLAEGLKKVSGKQAPVKAAIFRTLVLAGMPAPKGKIETYKELKQGEGGTKPVSLEADKKTLIQLVESFDTASNNIVFQEHPGFGTLSKKQWGRLIYIHLNHHLRQFGR